MKFSIWSILIFAIAIGFQAAVPGLAQAYPKAGPILTAVGIMIATVQGFIRPMMERSVGRLEEPPK